MSAMSALGDCFICIERVVRLLRQEIVGFWALVRARKRPGQTIGGKKALVTPGAEQKEEFHKNK